MTLFRKQAITHRYETGWARIEHEQGLAAWQIGFAVVLNGLVFLALYLMVY